MGIRVVIVETIADLQNIVGIHAHPATTRDQRFMSAQPLARQIVPTLQSHQAGLVGTAT